MPIHYEANWESLKQYQIPQWYEDAKFGIFIHWGVYAVPAFGNEWYPRNMYLQDKPEFAHHVETYGPQNQFGYKDFIPLFKAEKFDPQAWAALFRDAGARFVMPVAEHHDGFAMYETPLNRWNAREMGPGRDIVGELAQAIRDEGMVFTLSTHRAEHWWFLNGGREFESDVQDEQFRDFYGPAASDQTQPDAAFLEEWLERTCELVDKYRPQVVWFDWWIEQPAFASYLQRFAAYYYNRGEEWGQGVAINYKNEAFPEGTAVFDVERGQLEGIRYPFWQTDTAVAKNSWSNVRDLDYKTVDSLIDDLIDIVSKNGALLLNIGPRADGTIPEAEQTMLREIGSWLRIHGEAIYQTRPWHSFGEGPTQVLGGSFNDTKREAFTAQDIRFTTRGDTLYALCLARPQGEVRISSLASGAENVRPVTNVQLVGSDEVLSWSQEESTLTIQAPQQVPSEHACAFRITFSD
jgi:alpha-L-fucosidase